MELRQLKYFIKVGEPLSRSGLDTSILGAIYIGTIHAYCKFLLGETDARYGQYHVLEKIVSSLVRTVYLLLTPTLPRNAGVILATY